MKYQILYLIFFIILIIGCSTTKIDELHNNQIQDFIKEENNVNQVINMKELTVSSTAFGYKKSIPSKYTCDGDDINPPLTIENIPQGAISLVLINDDPDAPIGNWDHWIVYDIPITNNIGEDSVPGTQG